MDFVELVGRSRDEAGGLRLTGEGSMLGELIRAVLERALEAELTAHLGYEKGGQGGNARNGTIAKTDRPQWRPMTDPPQAPGGAGARVARSATCQAFARRLKAASRGIPVHRAGQASAHL